MKNNSGIEEYYISDIDAINFEGDKVVNPVGELRVSKDNIDENEYYFIQTNQLKNNLIVIALEPKSTLGLHTYKEFEFPVQKQ